jgi:hypothetical protein
VGYITFDLRRAPYTDYPGSLDSIISGVAPPNTAPNLAGQQVATGFPQAPYDELGAPLGWGYLFEDDILDFWVTAALPALIARVSLTLHCRVWQ